MQHHEGISEPVMHGRTLRDENDQYSLLLHLAVFDSLAIEDLWEPVEDWMQNERPNLHP